MRRPADPPVVVSACLLGVACRWDGRARRHPGVVASLRGQRVLPVCPEAMAGWSVPRRPVWFADASLERLVDATGRDATGSLRRGVERAAAIAGRFGVRRAILAEGSPSCGVERVWWGERRVRGSGLFARALQARGIDVRSDEDFAQHDGNHDPEQAGR